MEPEIEVSGKTDEIVADNTISKVIDDDDTEITDPGEILGLSWGGGFGIMSEDEDIVFVRNEVLGIDYEVLRDEKSWNEVKFGIDVYSGEDLTDDEEDEKNQE